jgi:two-component system response regulator PhoP
MEYRLLEYLAMRAGEVVSKADIAEHLYSSYCENFSNVVEV